MYPGKIGIQKSMCIKDGIFFLHSEQEPIY